MSDRAPEPRALPLDMSRLAGVDGEALGALLRAVRADRLSPARPAHAFGIALAAAEALCAGCAGITVIELGVGAGDGLQAMATIGERVAQATGLDVEVVGFDRGTGLPPPKDARDHPEIWRAGQFGGGEELASLLPPSARLVIGDVATTIPEAVATLDADRPVGYVVLDLDLYSSTVAALELFGHCDPCCYLPAVPMYVDDVELLLTYNSWCGEALALAEFNQRNRFRKIERKPVRRTAPPKKWHQLFSVVHVLDHPLRTGATAPVLPFELNVDDF